MTTQENRQPQIGKSTKDKGNFAGLDTFRSNSMKDQTLLVDYTVSYDIPVKKSNHSTNAKYNQRIKHRYYKLS